MTVAVRERPIIFSGESVRAILDGRKTQTRRVVRFPRWMTCCDEPTRGMVPHNGEAAIFAVPGACYLRVDYCESCDRTGSRIGPPWIPGDRLWVRETWCPSPDGPIYRATEQEHGMHQPGDSCVWKPSIHMPRWACRLVLEVTEVRVQRVQEITSADAIAEGFPPHANSQTIDGETPDPRDDFRTAWDEINAKRGYSFESNPWVWVVVFRRLALVDSTREGE